MRDDQTITRHVEIEFEPTVVAAAAARREARSRLDDAGVGSSLAADLELVISELTTNAVEQRPSAPVRLELAITDADVVVTVTNEATGTVPELPRGTDHDDRIHHALNDRGWGLGIVEALTDELWLGGDAARTSISCRRRR